LGWSRWARDDDGLDGTAAPGFGQSGAEQFGAGCRPFPSRGNHEVVDLAGETARVVDPRRWGQGCDEEAGDLAGVLADQGDDVVAGDKLGQVRTLLVLGARSSPPSPPSAPVAIGGVTITTTTLPQALLGSPYSATLSATGGTTPYTWSATGLPPGLSVNPAAGTIAGHQPREAPTR
jgi:hypothetical protein